MRMQIRACRPAARATRSWWSPAPGTRPATWRCAGRCVLSAAAARPRTPCCTARGALTPRWTSGGAGSCLYVEGLSIRACFVKQPAQRLLLFFSHVGCLPLSCGLFGLADGVTKGPIDACNQHRWSYITTLAGCQVSDLRAPLSS